MKLPTDPLPTPSQPPGSKSSFRQEREKERVKLEEIARELERIMEAARTPGTAAHAELSVRHSHRLADQIGRKAQQLKEIRAPEPWVGAPTRERERQAGEEPRKEPTYEGGQATGVSHRWEWPVRQAQRKWILNAGQTIAADRFRCAFNDQQKNFAPTGYDSDPRSPSNPATRHGLSAANGRRQGDALDEIGEDEKSGRRALAASFPSRALALAGGEAGFVWKRLEPEFRAVAWALILEEPFPGRDQATGIAALGKELGHVVSDTNARHLAFGWLAATCTRLVSIYRHFDAQEPVPGAVRLEARAWVEGEDKRRRERLRTRAG